MTAHPAVEWTPVLQARVPLGQGRRAAVVSSMLGLEHYAARERSLLVQGGCWPFRIGGGQEYGEVRRLMTGVGTFLS